MLERLTWKLRATLLGNHASRYSTVQHTPEQIVVKLEKAALRELAEGNF